MGAGMTARTSPDYVARRGTARDAGRKLADVWNRYWFAPISPMRTRVLSVFLFSAILIQLRADLWMLGHGHAPESFWQPIGLARLFGLQPPGPAALRVVLAVVAVGCAAGIAAAVSDRLARTTSAVVLVSYTLWLVWAFSWAKVDHDRLTILVALLAFSLTPRRGANAAVWNGWAIRLIQVTFLLAYPLSAVAKLQHGGIEWMQSATFARAILRRGTWFGDMLLEPSWILVASQWAFVGFELFAIVLVMRRGPLRAFALFGVVMLHTMTYATIGIHFLPHTVCILAFFPLERLPAALRRWYSRLRPAPAGTSE
ncbi:MAG: hypothetical protein DYH08_10000 [Actinobacteria bacterium ATB1]|nr:hypothetical protein [Actinobacteria bacterium ATB1]